MMLSTSLENSKDILKSNINYIREKANINFTKLIKAGRFGYIYEAETPEKIAVKVINEEYRGDYEMEWMSFNNHNIVPLAKTTYFEDINIRIFQMPLCCTNLEEKN